MYSGEWSWLSRISNQTNINLAPAPPEERCGDVALYQGTTSVVPQRRKMKPGFSPCGHFGCTATVFARTASFAGESLIFIFKLMVLATPQGEQE
jgi:hypothetical protein